MPSSIFVNDDDDDESRQSVPLADRPAGATSSNNVICLRAVIT